MTVHTLPGYDIKSLTEDVKDLSPADRHLKALLDSPEKLERILVVGWYHDEAGGGYHCSTSLNLELDQAIVLTDITHKLLLAERMSGRNHEED
jgi:hypothetical protein